MMNWFWKWVYKKATQAEDPTGLLEDVLWRNERKISQIEYLLKIDRDNDSNASAPEITADLGSVIRTVRPYRGNPHLYSEIKKGKLK